MRLYKVYDGVIKAMHNTPCKVAIFTDGENFKVFQKAFYKNTLARPNWARNVILEKMNNIKAIENTIISSGFVVCNEQ